MQFNSNSLQKSLLACPLHAQGLYGQRLTLIYFTMNSSGVLSRALGLSVVHAECPNLLNLFTEHATENCCAMPGPRHYGFSDVMVVNAIRRMHGLPPAKAKVCSWSRSMLLNESA